MDRELNTGSMESGQEIYPVMGLVEADLRLSIPMVQETTISPIFRGVNLSPKTEAKRHLTSLSPAVMALKGIELSVADPREVYEEREQLAEEIFEKRDEYISSWVNRSGLPSISDKPEDPERAFYGTQFPIVQTAVDLGVIRRVPNNHTFWGWQKADLDRYWNHRISTPPINSDLLVVEGLRNYMSKRGYTPPAPIQ